MPAKASATSICEGYDNWSNYHHTWTYVNFYGHIYTSQNLDNKWVEFYNDADQLVGCGPATKDNNGYIYPLTRIYQTGTLNVNGYNNLSPMALYLMKTLRQEMFSISK